MENNRRKIFTSNKIFITFVIYGFFSLLSLVLFLGWEEFLVLLASRFSEAVWFEYLQGFPMVIKSSLLLLWGMFSFLLSYIYLDTKFLGIFRRMDNLFQDMHENDDLILKFRAHDSFAFLADSFNEMKNMFTNKISSRKKLLQEIEDIINNSPDDISEEQALELINKIDKELER